MKAIYILYVLLLAISSSLINCFICWLISLIEPNTTVVFHIFYSLYLLWVYTCFSQNTCSSYSFSFLSSSGNSRLFLSWIFLHSFFVTSFLQLTHSSWQKAYFVYQIESTVWICNVNSYFCKNWYFKEENMLGDQNLQKLALHICHHVFHWQRLQYCLKLPDT